uniref:SPK domain-containing protein n=1 Tax=Caenorhabditis japonica TaxID=281687 RepID=A0A8R1HXL6_CAEJA
MRVSVSDAPPQLKNPFTPEEDESIWRFLVGNPRNMGPMALWKKFKMETLSKRTVTVLSNRFKYILAPNLHVTKLSMPTKLDLYRKYKLPVNERFRVMLQRRMRVDIDDQGYIVEKEDDEAEGGKQLAPIISSIKELINNTVVNAFKQLEDVRQCTSSQQNIRVKLFLRNLKRTVFNLNSSALKHIEQRIDYKIQCLRRDEVTEISVDEIRSVLDIMLKIVGR